MNLGVACCSAFGSAQSVTDDPSLSVNTAEKESVPLPLYRVAVHEKERTDDSVKGPGSADEIDAENNPPTDVESFCVPLTDQMSSEAEEEYESVARS